MADLSYPIGEFVFDGDRSEATRRERIGDIAAAPGLLRAAISGLSAQQLDTPYRPGGWTVRQVVHHVPESHMNAYIRFKLALTEDRPTIKPYEQARWAELGDVPDLLPEVSLRLLEPLHERWVALLRSMAPADFDRSFMHPEYRRAYTLHETLAMYSWHGRHHTAHITELRKRKGW